MALILPACGVTATAPAPAAPEASEATEAERRPAVQLSTLPFVDPPRPVGDGYWLVGGVRVQSAEGGFRAAPEALSGVGFTSAVRCEAGWVFLSEAGQRIWRAPEFLGDLELVAVAPEGQRWSAVPSGGGWLTVRSTDGLLYGTDGSGPPTQARGLEDLSVVVATVSPNGRGRAIELGRRWLESDDGGRSWQLGGPASNGDIEQLRRDTADSSGGWTDAVADVFAAVAHRFEQLGAAHVEMDLANPMVTRTHAGLVFDLRFGRGLFLVEGTREAARARRLETGDERCRLLPAGLVECAGGLWAVGARRPRRVVRFPDRFSPQIVQSADGSELLVDIGCQGEASQRCLVDRRSGESETLDTSMDLSLRRFKGFADGRVLVGTEQRLAFVDLRTSRSEPVAVPSGLDESSHARLLSDQTILFQRAVDFDGELEAHLLTRGRLAPLALPEGSRELHMFDARAGVVVTEDQLLATTDGGQRWVPLTDSLDHVWTHGTCRGSACRFGPHLVMATVDDLTAERIREVPWVAEPRALELSCDTTLPRGSLQPTGVRMRVAPHRRGRRYTVEWTTDGRQRRAQAVASSGIDDARELGSNGATMTSPSGARGFNYCGGGECGTLLVRGDGSLIPIAEGPNHPRTGRGFGRLSELGPTDHLVELEYSTTVDRVRGTSIERVSLVPCHPTVRVDGDQWSAGEMTRHGDRRRVVLVSPSGDRQEMGLDAAAFGRGCEADSDAPLLLVPMPYGRDRATAAVRLDPTPCLEWVRVAETELEAQPDGSLRAPDGSSCRIAAAAP